LLATAFLSASTAQPISGPAKVITGDTIELPGQRLKLAGIDAPDVPQGCRTAQGEFYRCGEESWKFLNSLVQGHSVSCSPLDGNHGGQKIARCHVGGKDLANEIVRSGHAVAAASATYPAAEKEARVNKRGLWAGTFVLPSEWRRRMKQNPPIGVAK
jgi:endonuclease YncB( thermonuclease family)